MYLLHELKEDCIKLMRRPSIRAHADFSMDYDRYWEERGNVRSEEHLHLWQRERALLASTRIERGSTVLDIGSGGGSTLVFLREAIGIVPIGADISEYALQLLKKKNIPAYHVDLLNQSDIDSLPEVDYIIGFEIVEHLSNPEQAVFALAKKARRGMFFSFPNTGYYVYRLQLLFGSFPVQWVAHPGEHLRFWTVRDARRWVPALGLRLAELIVYQGPPIFKSICPSLFGRGIMLHIDTRAS
jgi:2-polyprenyl-3-methyl-5-hydroxy-6-metoxy-1,4-benzoquinol methylase